MTDLIPPLLAALLGGIIAGLLYFWGLWWTVRRVPQAEFPYALLIASFVLRMVVLTLAILFVAKEGWQFLAIAMVGFLAARQVLIYWTRRATLE